MQKNCGLLHKNLLRSPDLQPTNASLTVQSMKKGGLDKATAQRILKVWEETGASSPEGLRKLLLGRSLRTVGVVALQLLLDAGTMQLRFSLNFFIMLVDCNKTFQSAILEAIVNHSLEC